MLKVIKTVISVFGITIFMGIISIFTIHDYDENYDNFYRQ